MSVISGPYVNTDGLVLFIDTINPRFNADTPLTYDYSVWATGQTSSIGQFTAWQSIQNDRITATDPWGEDNVVWRVFSGVTGRTHECDGGIYCSQESIDRTKLYRISYWENRVTNGNATYGRYYMGCHGYPTGVGNLTNETPNTNPYFWSTTHTGLPTDTWFLCVGHIHPYEYTAGVDHPDSGRWAVDGSLIGGISTDYRWRSDTTTAMARTLAVYYGDAYDMEHHSLYPRMDFCDGSQPSLEDLLYDRPEQTRNMIDGSRIGVSVESFENNFFTFNNKKKCVVNLGDYTLGDSFSVGVWVNVTSLDNAYNPIISKDDGVTGNFSIGFDVNRNIQVKQYSGETVTYGPINIYDEWHHIFVVIDSLVCSLYVNGVIQTGDFTFSSSFDDTGDIKLGVLDTSYFNGYIQLPMIYNEPLTSVEVLQNFNAFKSRYNLSGLNVVTDKLVLYVDAANTICYPGTGTTYNDLSGNGNDGTLVNGVGFSTRAGGTFEFDGDNNYMNAGNGETLDIVSGITLEAWVNPNSWDIHYPIFMRKLDNYRLGLQGIGDGQVYFRLIIDGVIKSAGSTSVVEIGEWAHVVGTYDGAYLTIYINGAPNGTPLSAPGTIDINGSPLVLGAYSTAADYPFDGDIANMRVYDKALSQEEITQNFNAYRSRFGV